MGCKICEKISPKILKMWIFVSASVWNYDCHRQSRLRVLWLREERLAHPDGQVEWPRHGQRGHRRLELARATQVQLPFRYPPEGRR